MTRNITFVKGKTEPNGFEVDTFPDGDSAIAAWKGANTERAGILGVIGRAGWTVST